MSDLVGTLPSNEHNVLDLCVRLSVRPFVCPLPNCDHYILKTNEPISMQIHVGTSDPGARATTVNQVCQKVKVKGGRS